MVGRARRLHIFARLLLRHNQLKDAEQIALTLQPIDFLREEGRNCSLQQTNRVLGVVYDSTEKVMAVHHSGMAL